MRRESRGGFFIAKKGSEFECLIVLKPLGFFYSRYSYSNEL